MGKDLNLKNFKRQLNEDPSGAIPTKLEALLKVAKAKKSAAKAKKLQEKAKMSTATEQCEEEIIHEQKMDLVREFLEKSKMEGNEIKGLIDEHIAETAVENEMETEESEPATVNEKGNDNQRRTWNSRQKVTEMKRDKKEKKEVTAQKPKPIKKADKPPPITTKRIDPKEFDKDLGDTNVTYRLRKGDRITINCETPEDHGKVMALLREEKTGGHSHPPKALRKAVLIMKDIDMGFSVEEIKESIKEQSGLDVGVKRLVTPRSKNMGYTLDIALITTEEKNVNQLHKIFSIHNQIIKWERLIKKGLTQCFNCQQFGHVASYCMNEYRCVKCDKQHKPKECQRVKNETTKPYCWNCKKEGHPASWGGCPKAVELREKVEENRTKKEIMRAQVANKRAMIDRSLNTMVTPDIQFSELFKEKKQARTPVEAASGEGDMSFLGNECRRLFDTDLFTLLKKAKQFVPMYRQLRTEEAQKAAYLDFVFSL